MARLVRSYDGARQLLSRIRGGAETGQALQSALHTSMSLSLCSPFFLSFPFQLYKQNRAPRPRSPHK